MLNNQQFAKLDSLLKLKEIRQNELAVAEQVGNHKAARFLRNEIQNIQIKRNAFLLSLGHNEMASAA